MPKLNSMQLLQNGLQHLKLSATLMPPLFELLQQLDKWNKAKNLTAIVDEQEMVIKHLLDSLSTAAYIEGNAVLDVGTGAGFPGLPLALVFPEKQFYLCDSNGKKTAFIHHMVSHLKLNNVQVIKGRVESLQSEQTGLFDTIISRAFSMLDIMLQKTDNLLVSGGCWLAMKGTVIQEELACVDKASYAMSVMPVSVPFLDAERHLIKLKKMGS